MIRPEKIHQIPSTHSIVNNLFRLFVGCALCLPASFSFGEDPAFYSRSVSGGLELETWLEMPAISWDSLVVCCRITNRNSEPHTAPYGPGTPPFLVSAFDRFGVPLKPSKKALDYFVIPGAIQFSTFYRELAPGESASARIPFTTAFVVSDPANARITVGWNPDLPTVTQSELTEELRLPEKPMLIAGLPAVVPKLPSHSESTKRSEGSHDTRYGWNVAWLAVALAVVGLVWLLLKKRRRS